MDNAFADLLTNEELINILVERQLNLPNIHQMSHRELVRIYKSFALPLARRELHRTTRNKAPALSDIDKQAGYDVGNNGNNDMLTMDVDDCDTIQLSSQKHTTNNIILSERNVTSEKRPRDYKLLNPLTDEYLSKAAKRIKIAYS